MAFVDLRANLTGSGTANGNAQALSLFSASLSGSGTVSAKSETYSALTAHLIGDSFVYVDANARKDFAFNITGSGATKGYATATNDVYADLTGTNVTLGRLTSTNNSTAHLSGIGLVFGQAEANSPFSAGLSGSGNLDGEITDAAPEETEAHLTGSSVLLGRTSSLVEFVANLSGLTVTNFNADYTDSTRKSKFFPIDEVPCIICCMIPDSLCFQLQVCGETYFGRLRRELYPGLEFYWNTCSSSKYQVLLFCEKETGEVRAVVNGAGTTIAKKPSSLCPFDIEWTHANDETPGIVCPPGIPSYVDSLRIASESRFGCPNCVSGANGSTVKEIINTYQECCLFCSCCNLRPGRDQLGVYINAVGCDFNNKGLVLDAINNSSCVFTGTLQNEKGGDLFPRCGEVRVTATCENGGWRLEIETSALNITEETPGFVTTASYCNPFTVVGTAEYEAST